MDDGNVGKAGREIDKKTLKRQKFFERRLSRAASCGCSIDVNLGGHQAPICIVQDCWAAYAVHAA